MTENTKAIYKQLAKYEDKHNAESALIPPGSLVSKETEDHFKAMDLEIDAIRGKFLEALHNESAE